MTDRELLELAAKAAGIDIDKSPYNGGGSGNTGFDIAGNAVLDWHNNVIWNPLKDDGDALRLAVKLSLMIDNSSEEGWCDIIGACERIKEEYGEDEYAATRRAIVRAAASIGKAMK